jgi:anti-sigma factor (TIGR02949 family)
MSAPDMLSCREALVQLWAFVDGELDASDAGRVREHLDACARCYPHYDFQSAFCAFLRSREKETAPPELRRAIFLHILQEAERERTE